MPVELSHLMQLALGQKPSLPVGDLPRPVATYLGCHPAIVYLGHEEMLKIAKKHSEIKQTEFQAIPYLIKDGEYKTDPKRHTCVTIFGYGLHNKQLYLAALKATNKGGEVWVATFHRTNPVQLKSWRRRGQTIHGHC